MGLFRRRKKAWRLTREEALQASPMHHPDVVEHETDDGCVRLTLPLAGKVRKGIWSWLAVAPAHRSITLDEIGSLVWRTCDGKRRVADVVDVLVETYKLNRRESEQSTMAFMKQLMERALLLMQVDKPKVKPDEPNGPK